MVGFVVACSYEVLGPVYLIMGQILDVKETIVNLKYMQKIAGKQLYCLRSVLYTPKAGI